MGPVTRGASRGFKFLAILGTASLSQISHALLSEGQTLLTSVGLEDGLGATLRYSIPVLPKEVTVECRGAACDGCNAFIYVEATEGSTTGSIRAVLAKCEWSWSLFCLRFWRSRFAFS